MADVWFPVPPKIDGLEILEDGTIMLPGLRAQALTYTKVFDTNGHLVSITPNKLRMTVAIPLDHRLTYGYKVATDGSSLPTMTGSVDDSDQVETDWQRAYHFVAEEIYKKWIRKDSWPIPETVIQTLQAATAADQIPWGEKMPDKLGASAAESLRDDLEYLQNHLKRKLSEMGRISRSGTLILKGACLQYEPGDAIKMLNSVGGGVGDMPVRAVIKEVDIHCGPTAQWTGLVLS